MTKECFLQASEPITAFKLHVGAKSENKSRPIKIKFNDEAKK